MAERKAVNKYYPPEWDPSGGSINKYNKSHPLRDRAKKIDKGILVIRFGMPFNIWCLKCENHIGMGVRYNAEKSKAGEYYSTQIWSFKMKCHLCDNYFVIQTDPANLDYKIISGARRRPSATVAKTDDDVVNANRDQRIVIESAGLLDTDKKKIVDSMSKLETKVETEIKEKARISILESMKNWRDRLGDNYTANKILRDKFRARRKKLIQTKKCDKEMLKKMGLPRIPLVADSPSFKEEARALVRKTRLAKLNRKINTI